MLGVRDVSQVSDAPQSTTRKAKPDLWCCKRRPRRAVATGSGARGVFAGLCFVAVFLVALTVGSGASARASVASKGRALIFFNSLCTACRQDAARIRPWAVRERANDSLLAVGFRMSTADSRRFARRLGWWFPAQGDPSGRLAARCHVDSPTMIVLIDGHSVQRTDYANWRTVTPAPTPKPKPNPKPPARPGVDPQFVASFDPQQDIGQGRYVLIRYLSPPADAGGGSADQAFAQDAAGTTPGMLALAVTCASHATVDAQLRAAQIAAARSSTRTPAAPANSTTASTGSPTRTSGSSGCLTPSGATSPRCSSSAPTSPPTTRRTPAPR